MLEPVGGGEGTRGWRAGDESHAAVGRQGPLTTEKLGTELCIPLSRAGPSTLKLRDRTGNAVSTSRFSF